MGVEEQILLHREGQGVDHVNNPLVRHNRKSSVSSVNSISSSKSDSCSSGSMRLTEPPISAQNSERHCAVPLVEHQSRFGIHEPSARKRKRHPTVRGERARLWPQSNAQLEGLAKTGTI